MTKQNSVIYNLLGDGAAPILSFDKQLSDFTFQIYIEIDIIQNGVVIEPKIFTGVKYSYELDDVIELPLKICELAPLSSLAISIYSMDKVEEIPIACTVIDLFDSKRRLRQGTWNLMLHNDKVPD